MVVLEYCQNKKKRKGKKIKKERKEKNRAEQKRIEKRREEAKTKKNLRKWGGIKKYIEEEARGLKGRVRMAFETV